MIKLLTALLIAGLSATAKAEPVVYYCNTTAFADVVGSEINHVRSYPFKLFVDLQNKRIKLSGEFADSDSEAFGKYSHVRPWHEANNYGEDAFYANTFDEVFDFRNNTLAYARVNANQDKELFATAVIARCDKF